MLWFSNVFPSHNGRISSKRSYWVRSHSEAERNRLIDTDCKHIGIEYPVSSLLPVPVKDFFFLSSGLWLSNPKQALQMLKLWTKDRPHWRAEACCYRKSPRNFSFLISKFSVQDCLTNIHIIFRNLLTPDKLIPYLSSILCVSFIYYIYPIDERKNHIKHYTGTS